jgi:hypothetical protein
MPGSWYATRLARARADGTRASVGIIAKPEWRSETHLPNALAMIDKADRREVLEAGRTAARAARLPNKAADRDRG